MAKKTKPRQSKSKAKEKEEEAPPQMEYSSDEPEEEEDSVYDSEDGLHYDNESGDDDDEDDDGSESDDDFEDQGSSDEDEDLLEKQKNEDDSDDDIDVSYEKQTRRWKKSLSRKRGTTGTSTVPAVGAAEYMHTDNWSSDEDDAEGTGNRIGRVPLHWYDDYDHIGYDAHGKKIAKSASLEGGDRLDQALQQQENMKQGKYVVLDALNDRNVELSARQVELIQRIRAGAYAHAEHDAYPDLIDYFSGVNPEKTGLHSDTYMKKSYFQPNPYEKKMVDKLLEKLEKGYINMDYLTGKIRDMNDVHKKGDPNKPYGIWTEDDEDLLATGRGPQHIAAPKVPPPGHAESYIPPDEYLPTEKDLEEWKDMEPQDRPHGLLVPKKFPNLRSVGAYEHSVREAFERCLDLYLCPRVLKRRLNIDPESLVPKLPRAADLRPFPTAKCVEYVTPYDGDQAPAIRAISPSPDGQFVASGAADGYLRIWEVQTGRLLRSWDVSSLVAPLETDKTDEERAKTRPVVSVEWNPNPEHHCALVAVGSFVVVVGTGTASSSDADVTKALFASAVRGAEVTTTQASKAVQWHSLVKKEEDRAEKPLSAAVSPQEVGPICALRTKRDVASVRWQAKGDYFVSVSPKAAAAAVLIHQLSKGNSQQPFSKAKGESQLACFHPNKPFLFVASQQHVRVYHLVKQTMVKRLMSGCRWISSIDIHPTGDHLIVGSLDRRMVWFDLDLSATPFKTLKYHERAIRSCGYHRRYPLMASASDDGAVHVFHSMVYSDLMRNPMIVPVKILRGHTVTNKFGVLNNVFHPTQPWIFTGGADGKMLLWQDV